MCTESVRDHKHWYDQESWEEACVMFHLFFYLWSNSFRLKGPREARNRDAYEWIDMDAMYLDVSRLGLRCLVWQYLDGYHVNHSAGRACIICSAENEFSLG